MGLDGDGYGIGWLSLSPVFSFLLFHLHVWCGIIFFLYFFLPLFLILSVYTNISVQGFFFPIFIFFIGSNALLLLSL